MTIEINKIQSTPLDSSEYLANSLCVLGYRKNAIK